MALVGEAGALGHLAATDPGRKHAPGVIDPQSEMKPVRRKTEPRAKRASEVPRCQIGNRGDLVQPNPALEIRRNVVARPYQGGRGRTGDGRHGTAAEHRAGQLAKALVLLQRSARCESVMETTEALNNLAIDSDYRTDWQC